MQEEQKVEETQNQPKLRLVLSFQSKAYPADNGVIVLHPAFSGTHPDSLS